MAVSPRAFLVELYEEYLAEASFLYAQRRTLYSNPEIAWKKIGEFEDRLEAHIDGLVVGAKLALDVCASHAADGDFGELYAAVCVLCRQDQRDQLLKLLDRLDPGDLQKAGALADALKYELPKTWVPDFRTLLASGDPKLAPVLARAFGYRRTPCGPELLTAVRRCAASAMPEIVWALGRVAHEPARGLLLDYLKSEDESVRSASAIALARIGERNAVDYCLDQAPSKAWAVLPVALAGGRSALPALTRLAEQNHGPDCLIALGLLGDPASMPLLLSRLEDAAMAPAAAAAIECLTGAGLHETVFVPDEIDDAELFESEREQLTQGKVPDRGDGRPFGTTVRRLSQKPEDWNRWWHANAAGYIPALRYRNGALFSPKSLVAMLTAGQIPHQLRCYCAEELATRYQNDFGIELDMPVRHQAAKLTQAAAWSQTEGARFQDGQWYFAAHRCT